MGVSPMVRVLTHNGRSPIQPAAASGSSCCEVEDRSAIAFAAARRESACGGSTGKMPVLRNGRAFVRFVAKLFP